MFDSVSPKYDLLNRVISLGIDQSAKKVVQFVGENNPKQLLDIATGTGDLAIALQTTQAEKIVGLDISPGMLNIGKDKVNARGLNNRIEMILGDSEDCPLTIILLMGLRLLLGCVTLKPLKRVFLKYFESFGPKGNWSSLKRLFQLDFPLNKAIGCTADGLSP